MTSDQQMRAQKVASKLAEIELHNFASRLGLSGQSVMKIDQELAVKAASCLDDLSWECDGNSSRLAILIMSILWEYSPSVLRSALRERFVIALSRLGLSPTSAMIDAGFNDRNGYEAFESFRAQIATTAMQLQYSEVLCGNEYLLTKFQKEVISKIRLNRLVGVSAPTSAGKSFAIYLSIIDAIANRGARVVVYIVPTVSLINQVMADLRNLVASTRIEGVTISDNCDVANDGVNLFVLTQERALWGLQSSMLQATNMLVVDEVQNLERVGQDDELRSKILLDVLNEFATSVPINNVVLSGPRLEKIGLLGANLFGGEAVEIFVSESPVASLTYSISGESGRVFLTQHREGLLAPTLKLEIDSMLVEGLGKATYSEEFLAFLGRMIAGLGADSQNIVFSPTSDQSVKTALSLGVHVGSVDLARASLANYLADSVHPGYSLTQLVRTGIAYHHGKVPPHARFAVEEAFRDGLIRNLVCTTTLMQGVNLPANVVFIRNPKLYVRAAPGKERAELSAYEFANLRGRAGRLMQDLVGRTVVLDEESFAAHKDPQGELFDEARKVLTPGYGGMFEANREEVLLELRKPLSVESRGAKFVVSQIRQTAMRLGDAGHAHLDRLGIRLTERQYRDALSGVSALSVDPEVCERNRYWDPFDLQLMHDSFEASGLRELPDSVWNPGFLNILCDWLAFHAKVVPYYFDRYLRTSASDKFVFAIAKSAESWAREHPLRRIVDDRHFDQRDFAKIDEQIGFIYKYVVFGLPSLLKPLTEMRGSGGAALAAIESGVFNPVSRFLVAHGVYRETAIQIRLRLLPEIGANDQGVESEVISRISRSSGSLDPWIRRQLATFFH